MIIPVILCGGSGKRLWPLSTKNRPKQFSKFLDNKTLLSSTIERAKLINKNICIVIGSQKHEKLLKKECGSRQGTKIFLEGVQKNTATPILISAISSLENFEDSNILVMPSDHYISDNTVFLKSVKRALKEVNNFNWITFGTKPNWPSTSYGYIKTKKNKNTHNVVSFVEKPNLKKAKAYIEDKNYFWNSGIFLGKSQKIISSFKTYAPDIYEGCEEIWKNRIIYDNVYTFNKKIMSKIRSESVDYAILEKDKSIGLHELKCQWSDLGSWDSISDLYMQSNKLNKKIYLDTEDNFIMSDKKVATIGLKGYIVVDHNDGLLIVKKGLSENVKKLYIK